MASQKLESILSFIFILILSISTLSSLAFPHPDDPTTTTNEPQPSKTSASASSSTPTIFGHVFYNITTPKNGTLYDCKKSNNIKLDYKFLDYVPMRVRYDLEILLLNNKKEEIYSFTNTTESENTGIRPGRHVVTKTFPTGLKSGKYIVQYHEVFNRDSGLAAALIENRKILYKEC
ncbi:hypothetical protein G9A89_004403 [Geosiphon pyriformis]|nr:hypothetical protein G9A89_004403 [Geosiphon pyriformis]